ncbi:MAG: T9SS type A sorting domain-containing protein [Cyclobacteriaceae bacterium]
MTAIAQSTTVTSVNPPGTLCAGANVTVAYTATGFAAVNNFTIQLSDNAGSFAAPVSLGTVANSTSGGSISVTLPLTATAGAAYRIRVIGSNPGAGTATSSAALTISAVGLSAPTGLSTRCAGTTFNVTNNLAGTCSFGTGNTFTVQLSDGAGSFVSPVNIGSNNTTSGGNISVTLPSTTAGSASYRVRVVSTNPAITSAQSAAFTITALGINAPTVSASFCQGASFNVTNNLATACSFGVGNTFTVQLSDQFGSFASATNIGSVTSGSGGAIPVSIPTNQTAGTVYRMRVVSSNPVITGNQTGNLTINSPGLNAPTGLSTQCAGATFNITNNLTGCSFFPGNTFTVQLSDASGSFASPVSISAAVSATTGGAISVTLPLTLPTSAAYRIQVVGTNPSITSTQSAAFTINGFGLNAPTITGGSTSFCQGQNISIAFTLANNCGFPNTPSANIFRAQLSDAAGSFASPTVIGTVTANTAGTISANIGNPPAGTGYRIRVVSSNPGAGIASPDNGTNLVIGATTGNPSVFGSAGWNAYVYNSTTLAGFTNYAGFYTVAGLSFDTGTQYGSSSSPAGAPGYSGCSVVGATQYGIAFKRTNFTCGYYQIDVPYQDDQLAVYVNGALVFQNTTFTGTAQNNVWRGFLNSTSTVEYRLVNLNGPGQLQINLAPAANPLTVSPNIVQCAAPVNPGVLTVSSVLPLSYVWTPNGPGSGLTPASGVGASVTAAPTITTTYTATGTDATSGCSVSATVTVTVSNAKPTITATSTLTNICSGITTATLTAIGGTNYQWTPTTGLTPGSGIGYTVTANPASTTTYTVTGDNGCAGIANSNTATITVNAQSVPPAPATTTFGNGTWNVYAFFNDVTYTNYYGYYTENNLSFNTTSRWGNNAGPSAANAATGLGYQGCLFTPPTVSTNYSMSFKRTNFTCGYYQVDVNYQDDRFTLFVDGVQVFQNNAFTSTLQSNVWTGFLGPASQVEMRLINNGGPGQLQVTFAPSSGSPQVISPSVTICAGTTTSLTATSTYTGATYSWSVSPNEPTISFVPNPGLANPILQTTAATPLGNYTLISTMTDAGGTGCSANATNTLTVNPLPSTSVTPTAVRTYCPANGITLTASGANTYTWNPATGLSATTGHQVIATPTTTTTYTVTGSNNCSANFTTTTITVLPLPAYTSFPSGTWNVYGFNSTTVGTNYQGFYTENGSGTTGYDFNTTTRWASGAAPSTANATNGTVWQGCAMNATNISLSFKRTGFACGTYQINVPYHDDYVYLIINGVTVAQHVGCCDSHTALWTGVLNPNSQVEVQLVQGAGGSGLNVTFTPVAQPVGTNIWTGATSNDWFTASNWCGSVPTLTTDALIPATGVVNMPVIGGVGAVVRSITINGAVPAGTYTNPLPAASLTTAGSNALDVYGNWTNSGTLTPNTGSVNFAGSSLSTINATVTETFYNLSINNGAGVTLASGTHQVSNQLTLINGIVNQNATFNLLNGSSVTGASNASYVNGLVTKIGNAAFTFPVGAGGFYQPIGISAPTLATDAFTARYIYGSANASFPLAQLGATLDHVSAAEYWLLNRTTGSSNVGVTLNWNTNSGGVGNLPSLRVARWDVATAKWVDQGNGGTTGTTVAGTVVTSSAVNVFSTPNSPFTIGTTDNFNTLPVTLVDFSCTLTAGFTVQLDWATASEINNGRFDIERSVDGRRFNSIGSVSGAGTTSVFREYTMLDPLPAPGYNYYRLTQVDLDGKATPYEVCTVVNANEISGVRLFPNPASDQVKVSLPDVTPVNLVRLKDESGKPITVPYTTSGAAAELNTSSLSPGLYFVELESSSGLYRQKLVIVR